LACLQSATMECKSLVLALAYISRHLTLDQVKAASRLEEEFQLEVWGVVEGGHDMDRLNNSVNLSAVSIYRYTDI
jgi:ATP synthase F1 complex assembly factor 2